MFYPYFNLFAEVKTIVSAQSQPNTVSYRPSPMALGPKRPAELFVVGGWSQLRVDQK